MAWATITEAGNLACLGGVENPHLTLGRMHTPPGDETLRFTGLLTFDTEPTIDPAATGVRLRLASPLAIPMLDVTLPPGPAWRSKNGSTWIHRDRKGAVGGITRVVFRRTTPYTIAVTIAGRRGTYADWVPDSIFLSIVLDASPHGSRICAETAFPRTRCSFISTGRTLRCAPPPPLVSCTDSTPDVLIRCAIQSAVSAQEAYWHAHHSYFSGYCSTLYGFVVPSEVYCATVGDPWTFTVQTSHPQAAVTCVWSTPPSPNRPNPECG
jgi:hypothetical protein